MRILIIGSLLFVLLFGCKGKSKSTATNQPIDTTTFFPVTFYLEGQINAVNRTPFFIYKLDIVDGKKDSAAIDNNGFNEFAKQFINPNINDPSIKKYYTESVFYDQSTKSYTLSYTTINKELPLQNVDILLNEDGKTVKRVFLRKFINYKDSSAMEQLSWKPDERLQIIRLLQKTNDKRETSHQTIIVWNDKGQE